MGWISYKRSGTRSRRKGVNQTKGKEMKIEIEIDDLIGYQFKSDENKVVRFEDMSRREQIKVLNAFANGYELFLTALKEE